MFAEHRTVYSSKVGKNDQKDATTHAAATTFVAILTELQFLSSAKGP